MLARGYWQSLDWWVRSIGAAKGLPASLLTQARPRRVV